MDIKTYSKIDQNIVIPNSEDFLASFSDSFAESILELLYPKKIIKRIVYQPILGKWYPYLDVVPSYHTETQLSLLYGKINLLLLNETECIICGDELKQRKILEEKAKKLEETKIFNKKNSKIPIALCAKCKKKVFFNYYSCLESIIPKESIIRRKEGNKNKSSKQTYSERDNLTTQRQKELKCENFLSPDCNFPINLEKTNPCLKNHAIGITIMGFNTVKIFVAPVDIIRYKMIRAGGICGIILGYTQKILNLDQLKDLFRKFFKKFIQTIRMFSNGDQNEVNIKLSNKRDKIKVIEPFRNGNLREKRDMAYELFVLHFFNYYNDKTLKRFTNNLIKKAAKLLKRILKEAILDFDLEILEFLELIFCFTPIKRAFREDLEKIITKNLNFIRKEEFKETFKEIISERSKDGILLFTKITEIIEDYISFYDLKKMPRKQRFEIYEILCAFGTNLLVKTNLSKNPIIIDMDEMIGRKIV